MLSYLYESGAYEKDVKYTSVIGSAVRGGLSGNPSGALALISYSALSGVGETAGDGKTDSYILSICANIWAAILYILIYLNIYMY